MSEAINPKTTSNNNSANLPPLFLLLSLSGETIQSIILSRLRGVLDVFKSPATALTTDKNAELKLLLISKMDSVTHKKVINADNRNSAKEIWNSIK
ncbi:hypothetical protein VP01_2861g1 [Puccinia sorghi]|uniref:Uncharacterized protein n=1 Tax=Puccinia sorghi TaxID=27349 RepID=A0A0L6V1W4_9BASI|nr:hypothetical protein VP01_2861g1 [Puccinia sorghi]